MKKKIISGVVIVIMAIMANYSIYTDLKESAKVAQEAIKSMNTILIAVQSEIISWEEEVSVLQEHIAVIKFDVTETINNGLAQKDELLNKINNVEQITNSLNQRIENIEIKATEQIKDSFKSKKEELKTKLPGLDKLKF